MKGMKHKRQQFAKEVRSRQRNKIFAQNRQKLYDSYEQQSLVTLIFLMIDKDQEQITPQSFEEFLQIISEEILQSSLDDKKINEGIAQAVLSRYDSMLSEFEDKIKQSQKTQRICLIFDNQKQFDLIRFLIRLQVIQERHLMVLDLLLQSANIRLHQLIKNISHMLQSKNNNQNEQSSLLDELIILLELRYKIHKQLTYLYFLTALKWTTQQQDGPYANIGQKQKQIIVQLTQRWILEKLVVGFLFQPQLIHTLKQSHSHQQKITHLSTKYQQLYLGFLIQHDYILKKVINHPQNKTYKTQKFIQLVFILFSSLNDKKQSYEIEIGQCNNSIDDKLILFMDLSVKIVKQVQIKMGQSQKNTEQNKYNYQSLLKCLIDSFIQEPNKMEIKNHQEIIQSYNFLNKLNNNNNYKQSQKPLIIKLLHSIEDLEYFDLVTFVQLLSIIMSYNQTAIDLLFKAPSFQTYYDQKLNFQNILQKKLLRHMSGEVRRRAAWMLSNITGSEEFYYFGLKFIKSFYIENVLQDYSSSSSSEMSKQNALIKESMLQSIMNYLSNMRSFREIQELLQFDRSQSNQYQKNQSYHSQKYTDFHKQSNKNETLLIWIIRTLGCVMQNLANDTVIMKQTQKMIEVLIYSLYNILTLEQNHKQQQKQKNQHIILSMMQTYSIPKNLETIYHNSQTTNQYSTFFTMIETLLDLINKVRNQS